MSNSLDESIKGFQSGITTIIKDLERVKKEIIVISKEAREVANSLGSVKSPDSLAKGLKTSSENTEQLNALLKEQEALERRLISTIAKKTLAQESTSRAVSKENENLKILRREQRNQVKQVAELANSYEKLSAQTNLFIREYQGLSVQLAKGETLTDKQTKRFKQLGKSISDNQAILKKTDADVGRFNRNVGNYASTWDGLGNSINQLTREAPAFANSLQTGFLAISNNIPTLVDEINRLKVANAQLVKQGEPTESIFKKLSKSIFSWQTLISLGVTLLTIYGKQLVELIQKATKGADKVRTLAKNQKILNETYKEGAKSASLEVSKLQLLLAVAEDKTKSDVIRKKAVDKLIKSSNGLIKEQDRLNILNGEAVEIEEKLTTAILNKAIIEQLQTKISEDVNKLLDIQIAKRKEETKELNISGDTYENVLKGKNKQDLIRERILLRNQSLVSELTEEESNRLDLLNQAFKQEVESNSKNRERAVIQENINNLIKEALKLTDEYTLSLDDNTKSITKRNKALTIYEKIQESINTLSKGFEIPSFKDLDTETAKKSLESLREVFKDDESLKPLDIDLEEVQEKLDKFNKNVSDNLIDAFNKELLKEALGDLSSTIEQFTGVNADVLNNFFDQITQGGIKSFEDIADVASASFAVMGEFANSFYQGNIDRYQADIDANTEYYDNLLNNENLLEEDRKRLQKDKENRETELRNKQRKEQQKQAELNKAIAIAEIIVNTSRGVVEALPNIPLSVAVGAIGAVQLATALATPIPKFAEGGTMDKDGLMMINDHKSGRLEVVERDGKFLMTNKKNAVVEGKKGDIIHKDAKEFLGGIPENKLLENVEKYSILATIQHQNYLAQRADNLRLINSSKLDTDRIVKAIKGQKTKFNITNTTKIPSSSYLKAMNQDF